MRLGGSPSALEDVIRLSLLLGVLLLAAAAVARLAKRRRLVVLAGGVAVAAVATSLAWSAEAITYPTPGLTEAQGRQVESILGALREAAGPGDPARVPVSGPAPADATTVAQAPTLADVLAGVATTGPKPCLDRSNKDSGSIQFTYTRKANVVAPVSTPLAAPSADQVERVIAALTAAGFEIGTPNRYGYPEKAAVFVDGSLAGPPPLRRGDGTFDRDFVVRLAAIAERTSGPALAQVVLEVELRIALPPVTPKTPRVRLISCPRPPCSWSTTTPSSSSCSR